MRRRLGAVAAKPQPLNLQINNLPYRQKPKNRFASSPGGFWFLIK